jgi:hypothetical protein
MTDDHDIRRSAAEASHKPRRVPQREGADPSNTPIEELTVPLDADEDLEVRGMIRREVAQAHPDLLANLADADGPAAG